MANQHQKNQSKASAMDGPRSGQQAQQRRDDHTNSARAGEDPNRPDNSSDAGGQKAPPGQQ